MTGTPATPFTFETEFAADGRVLRDSGKWRLSFTREEMQAECEKAYERGRDDVLARAGETAAVHLQNLAEQSAQIVQTLNKESNAIRTQAMELVLVAARKIAGVALERYPQERLRECVSALFADLRGQARLVVTCAKEISQEQIKALHDMAEERGFDGALVIRQDEDAGPGDVTLEWAQGEICVNTQSIAGKVETAVRHWLAATETGEAQGDLFTPPHNADEEN